MALDTEAMSMRLRAATLRPAEQSLLMTNFHNTEQEQDFSEPANCSGFGRIRHFRRKTSNGWPSNPLPIDPACKALGLPRTDIIRAQVFQNAACNWRCWYCFVPFPLLNASKKHSGWLSAQEMVNLYLSEPERPPMIDLTGGQPDLVPEWVPWMMTELRNKGLEHDVFLWSDDNLSNDYFWQHLSEKDRELMAAYPKYGRVCCFKGFNEDSFSFNTNAEPTLFKQQFQLMGQLLTVGIDLYAYTTFTTPTEHGITDDMKRFVDRLQDLNPNLPLRTVPLEIQLFAPVRSRVTDERNIAINNQWRAIEAWIRELEDRFSSVERNANIAEIPLRGAA